MATLCEATSIMIDKLCVSSACTSSEDVFSLVLTQYYVAPNSAPRLPSHAPVPIPSVSLERGANSCRGLARSVAQHEAAVFAHLAGNAELLLTSDLTPSWEDQVRRHHVPSFEILRQIPVERLKSYLP